MKQCALCKGLLLALLALTCLLPPSQTWAQGGTGNVEVRFEDTDPSNFPTISVRVTVLDPEGVPITGLRTTDFDVFEDGQQVPVTQVESYVNPDVRIAVALLIDMSGSMYEEIADSKSAATTFVQGLGVNDLVAVIGFRGQRGEVNLDEPFPQLNPDREIDFSSDRAEVLALIDRLDVPSPLAGRTPLYDALFKATRMVSQVSGVDHRFVIAFTDGNEKCPDCGGSILKPDDPIDDARKHEIPVFTIGLGKDADEAYLQRVALMTGGTYQFTPTPDKLAEIYQGVADRLKQQYLITYRAKAPADGKEHKLDVKVTTPRGEGNNVMPIGYPCPQKPGVRLFYLKPSDVMGQEPTEEPLEDGQEVKASFTVVPDINACNPIDKVELYLDGELVFTAKNKPFHLVQDYYSLQKENPGQHRLTVRAYDDAGNASDDVVAVVNVPGIAPTPGSGTPELEQTAVPAEPELISQIPRWVWAVAGLCLLLLFLAAILLLTRRKQGPTCPTCGRTMDPAWTECQFCTVPHWHVDETTIPEQPAYGYADQDQTEPDRPAITAPPVDALPEMEPVIPPGIVGPAPDRTEILQREPQRIGWLIVEQGEWVGKEFRLLEGDTSIGRAGTNDVVLGVPTVSRQQAKIRLQPDGFYIHDLAATNATVVNGREISRHRLEEGDRVEFGDVVLVFKEIFTA